MVAYRIIKFLGAAAVGALLSGSVHAVVLVQYDFASGSSPSTTDPGVTVTQGAVGFTPNFTVNPGLMGVPAADIASTPVATDDYFTFTVTPTGGGRLWT